MELHEMKFDGDWNSLLKKWKSMDTDTYGIDYENMLKEYSFVKKLLFFLNVS